MTYLHKVALAVDQLINAVLDGYPDESLSARSYRWDRDGKRSWPRKVIDTLLFFDKDHCLTSYESEKLYKHLPPEYREPK